MSSNLKVNTILPSVGTAIGIGTAGGSVSITSDTITASTGGSERVRIKSDGKIGIGTDDPKEILHIHAGDVVIGQDSGASTNIRNYIKFGRVVNPKAAIGFINSTGNGRGNIIFMNSDVSDGQEFTDDDEVLRITSEGKVKIIGLSTTTNMQQSLQLLDTDSTDAIGTKSTLGLCGFVNGTGRTLAAVGARKNTAGNNFSGDLSFFTRRNNESLLDERVRITSAGNLNVLAGQVSVTTPEYLRVAHTNASHNQSLNDNSTAIVQFGSVYDDTKSGWTTGSSNYYTIQTTGYFLVTAQAVIHANTINTLRDFALGVEYSTDNGSSYSLIQNNGGRAGSTASTDTDTAMPVVTFVLNFTAGTRIRVRAHANTNGGNWQVDEDLGDATGGNDYGGGGFDNQKGTRLYIIRLF
tara:strand:- start:25 stop:1251 length:1227 start_codon:yes stop_codon:yes gene_type:complete